MADQHGHRLGERMRELAGHSFVYGLGAMVSKAIGIFLLPVYTHRVSQVEFGQVELMTATITLAAILLRLGLTNAMFRFSFDRRAGRDEAIQTCFSSVLVLATGGLVLGLLAAESLGSLLDVPTEFVMAGMFGLWVSMNYDVVAAIYRIEKRPVSFVMFTLINVALTIAISLLLVVGLDMGGLGIMIGNFAGSYVVYAMLLVARRHTLGFRRFRRSLLREMLSFSLPLVPAGVSLWALNVADRFQVQRLSGEAELGVYSAASKIALGVMLFVSAFQTAWAPFAHSIQDDEEARLTYRLAFSYWAVVMGWVFVAICALSGPYIHLAMPREWWSADEVVPLLMGGTLVYGAYMIVNIGVNRSKRTRMTPLVVGAGSATNIGLNFVLIPAFGLVGAGISTVVGYLVALVGGWLNAQTGFPVPYHWSRVIRIAAVTALLGALSVTLVPPTGIDGLALRVGLCIVYPLLLIAVGALTRGERRRMLEMARTVRRRPRRTAPLDAEPGAEVG